MVRNVNQPTYFGACHVFNIYISIRALQRILFLFLTRFQSRAEFLSIVNFTSEFIPARIGGRF